MVLILAREFAAELAVPVLVSDGDGRLVYFNEAAEEVLGQTFAEAGELPADLSKMPAGVALLERRPAHGRLQIVGLDEVRRTIEVTAIPLLAHRDRPVGVVAIFWPVR